MPSSTSSSERPTPAGDWRTIWIVALAIAVCTVLATEHWLRGLGQRPSVVDDPSRWALARRTVDDDARVIAFVGTSRLQIALSVEEASRALPGRHVVQLAINGVAARPILADLASDEHFHGVAVVDLDEWDIAWGDPAELAKPYLERSHALWRAPGAIANRLLGTVPQEHLASLAVGGRVLVTSLGRGKSPPPTWVTTDRQRVGHGDYTLASLAALQAKARARYSNFASPSPPPAAWLASAAELEPYVAAIRSHGGDVVFLRLPISGKLAELFDEHYPRAKYWDAFAAQTRAQVVHFRDVPAMRDLTCPDEMHLDQRDQARFTRALVEMLKR